MKRVLIGLDLPEEHLGSLPAMLERMAQVLRAEERTRGDISITERPSGRLRLDDDDDGGPWTVVGRWAMEVDDIDRWRHLKRDSLYDVVGTLTVQTDVPIQDNDVLTVYASVKDGEIFGRRPIEFYHPDRFVKEDID